MIGVRGRKGSRVTAGYRLLGGDSLGKFRGGGHEVEVAGEEVGIAALGDLAGPSGDEGGADAAFEEEAFVAAKAAGGGCLPSFVGEGF